MEFQEIRTELTDALAAASNLKTLEEVRVHFLGKKGSVTNATKSVDFSKLTPEEKRGVGGAVNSLKNWATESIAAKKAELESSPTSESFDRDLTLPGSGPQVGTIHPIRQVQLQLEEIFRGMGFRVFTGREVEREFYNFDALNIPADHPAREMQDTYWLNDGHVLRTHTSATQVRALKKFGAPVRAIFPGRCFRYEAVDASHENTFYQLEGFCVDRDITVANLIAVMKSLLGEVFGREVKVRLRPGYFPFVEPGFELDFECTICSGAGCSTCKKTGWIELIPCGLIHPRVLEAGGIDSKEYSGFAFGCGLTRLAMMKFHIPMIRLFNSGDLRFYEQLAGKS